MRLVRGALTNWALKRGTVIKEGEMIFIAGATGFVGSNLVDSLLSRGMKLKCLVRSDKAAQRLSARGVEVVRGDITQAETLNGILTGDDFVIHLIGIMEEKGKATFRSIHVEGTANLVSEARRAGVKHFFYQSTLGADRNSWSGYMKTKAEAEEIVKQSGINCTIFRPSLIIGPWDGFTKKLMEMIKLSPVIPIPGEGKSKFQPIYIGDWIKCLTRVIDDPEGFRATYEIGGPEHLSYTEMVEKLAAAMDRKRPVFKVPMGLMKISALFLGTVLSSPPVTVDQLRLLETDNTCDTGAVEQNFGFRPTRYEDALKEFIRP
jgi:uncharacterized protein YbjT (DUF2867 family)